MNSVVLVLTVAGGGGKGVSGNHTIGVGGGIIRLYWSVTIDVAWYGGGLVMIQD